MPTDTETLKDLFLAKFSTALGNADAKTVTTSLFSELVWIDKASDDAMASTTTAETYTGIYAPWDCKVTVFYQPTTGGITANDTNFATVTVSKRDSAAANKATVATLTTTTTSSGNLTQGVSKQLVEASGAVLVTAGSTFTFEIAKASAGVVVRAGRISILMERV